MYQDLRVDPDKYHDQVPPGRRDTFVVAAYDASIQSRAQADIVCTGAADELVINMIMGWLPAGGGRVSLTEGRFVPAHPIVPPINNITLVGQGLATFIDGDALPTGEHGIVVSGVTGSHLRDFSIQTEDGGGKVCQCICLQNHANESHIEELHIIASDSSGIRISDNTDDCVLRDNYIEGCDGYGIEIADNTCSRNTVKGNKLVGNVTGAILDAGTLTVVEDDNEGITISDIKMYRYVHNTSGGALAAGDVARLAAAAAGNEITTTAVLGDDMVYGMVAEAIGDDAWGLVQVKGMTPDVLSVSNDHGNIAIGDPLCCNDTLTEACLAHPGEMAFAMACEVCNAANCTITAYIKSPWD